MGARRISDIMVGVFTSGESGWDRLAGCINRRRCTVSTSVSGDGNIGRKSASFAGMGSSAQRIAPVRIPVKWFFRKFRD
jgi:hypothetical protein